MVFVELRRGCCGGVAFKKAEGRAEEKFIPGERER